MRFWDKKQLLVVESATEEDRPFLKPSREINALISGLLAKYLDRFDGVELFAFCFLSNGFRMLLRDTKGQLPAIMQDFKRDLAVAVNEKLGRKRARVFAGKYSAHPVLDDAEARDAFAEILCAPVLNDQVSTMAQSPFFGCHDLLLGTMVKTFERVDGSLLHDRTRRGQQVPLEQVTRPFELRLHPLPSLKGDVPGESAPARRRRITKLIRSEEQRAARERRTQGLKVLGARRVRSLDPHVHPPRAPMRSTRFVRAEGDPLLAAHHKKLTPIAARYRQVFTRFVKSSIKGLRRKLPWPPGTYEPSCLTPMALPDSG